MPGESRTLASVFLHSAETFPERPALEVGDQTYSYAALAERATAMAATLAREVPQADPPLTAVFAHRSPSAFAGILAALLRGHGYVPLNRSFPVSRTRDMLDRSGARTLIVDGESEAQLDELLTGVASRLCVLLPDRASAAAYRSRWPRHSFVAADDLEDGAAWGGSPPASPGSIAYLLFTSGSTGVPKGVMVTQRNVLHFVGVVADLYGISEHDRFSQTFDTTFDLSAFDMFVPWSRGACVCCLPPSVLMNPGRFIAAKGLTVWFSVPSTAFFMQRLGTLKPGRFLTLRWSLFCGEALPAGIAGAWAEAAPNSVVENLYGPTEVTIACTRYRWDPRSSPAECEGGIVPIGEPLPGTTARVVDERMLEVAPGCDGELILTGPQVAAGYWRDSGRTAKAFVVPPGCSEIHYRTGDRVRRPATGKDLRYLGRFDQQVQVLGHRVELGEVEAALRECAGETMAVALGWPLSERGAEGVVAFLAPREALDVEAVRACLARRLPGYMVPREIHLLTEFPLNGNGKIDRKQLLDVLSAREVQARATTAVRAGAGGVEEHRLP